MTDWKKLEAEVDKAIKGCPIDFDSKTKKECEYQQKVAEDRLSWMGVKINIIIFIAAVGFSILISFIRISEVIDIIGYSIAFIIIIAIYFFFYRPLMHEYGNCRRIILEAEERIISKDSIEHKEQQETTNNPPQVPENSTSKNQNIGKIELIKAGLDLYKILISAIVVACLGLGVYYLQSSKPDVVIVLIAIILLTVPLSISVWRYRKIAEKLKDLH